MYNIVLSTPALIFAFGSFLIAYLQKKHLDIAGSYVEIEGFKKQKVDLSFNANKAFFALSGFCGLMFACAVAFVYIDQEATYNRSLERDALIQYRDVIEDESIKHMDSSKLLNELKERLK